jgi:type IV pilus assembly protein PilZ
MEEEIPLIKCHFKDEQSLFKAYMPFVEGGGIFIATKDDYKLGDTIALEIKLLDDHELQEVEGKVVWITPKGAQGGKPQGVGLQLCSDNTRYLCNKIETYLAGMLNSANMSNTM